jgi:hypothetical protein
MELSEEELGLRYQVCLVLLSSIELSLNFVIHHLVYPRVSAIPG